MRAALRILTLAVLVGSSIATPRSAPEPTALLDVSQGASAPGPTGAPHVDSRDPALSAADVGQASTSGAPLIPLPPTRSSAQDAPGALAREGTPAQPTGQTAAHGPHSGSGGIPQPGPERFRGLATWFCLSGSSACTRGYDQDDLVAAIDTDLGFGKGDRVRVRYGDASVVVTITDVCLCPGDRLIDLTSGAFKRLANLDVGVIPVTLEVAGPTPTLPATEAAP